MADASRSSASARLCGPSTVGRAFHGFRRGRDRPGPDPAGRALEGMRKHHDRFGRSVAHPRQQNFGLTIKQPQDFGFQALLARRVIRLRWAASIAGSALARRDVRLMGAADNASMSTLSPGGGATATRVQG